MLDIAPEAGDLENYRLNSEKNNFIAVILKGNRQLNNHKIF